jgi:hypothetical protein
MPLQNSTCITPFDKFDQIQKQLPPAEILMHQSSLQQCTNYFLKLLQATIMVFLLHGTVEKNFGNGEQFDRPGYDQLPTIPTYKIKMNKICSKIQHLS